MARAPTPRKGRNFFHQVEPTFSIKPSATQLEFVDNSDPSKDLVVRKKARDWVYRNKEFSIWKTHAPGGHCRPTRSKDSNEEQQEPKSRAGPKVSSRALTDPSAGRIDPFGILPDVGRRVDHIIEFYHATSLLRIHILTLSTVLTECPEEVPCSDDKHAWQARRSDLSLSQDNTVLGTMATERVSFVLWLHATTVIRDGIAGNWDSEECLWYYKLALQTMREESKRKVTQYTDSFIASLACFTAAANFAGQYKAAEMHWSAMIKAITLKGDGDLTEGVRRCKPWTQKAAAWCEFHVAAQIPAVPKLPCIPPPQGDPLPYAVTAEAERLTNVSLSNLPQLPNPFPEIILQLHQLGLSQSQPPPSYRGWPGHCKIDPSVIRPLYCAEYTLLRILSAQREEGHGFTPFELMVSEACQLYLWTAIRGLPLQMKMLDLFVQRLKKALVPLLENAQHLVAGTPPNTTATASQSTDADGKQKLITSEDLSLTPGEPGPLDFVLLWALFLGTLVSSVGTRLEHSWFKDQFLCQMLIKNPGMFKTREDLKRVLKMFPYTEAFCGLGILALDIPF